MLALAFAFLLWAEKQSEFIPVSPLCAYWDRRERPTFFSSKDRDAFN